MQRTSSCARSRKDGLLRRGVAADRGGDGEGAVVGDELAVMLGLVTDPADEQRRGRLFHEWIRDRDRGFHLANDRSTRLWLARVCLPAGHDRGAVELLAAQLCRAPLEAIRDLAEFLEHRSRIGMRPPFQLLVWEYRVLGHLEDLVVEVLPGTGDDQFISERWRRRRLAL